MGRLARPRCKVCGVGKDGELAAFLQSVNQLPNTYLSAQLLNVTKILIVNHTFKKKIPNHLITYVKSSVQKVYLKATYNYLIGAMR